MQTLCGKEVLDEKKKKQHERMCKKCDEIFKTKPSLDMELPEKHALTVCGKTVYVNKVKPRP